MKWLKYGSSSYWDDLFTMPLMYYGSWNLVNFESNILNLNNRPISIFDPFSDWNYVVKDFYFIKSQQKALSAKDFFGDLLDE